MKVSVIAAALLLLCASAVRAELVYQRILREGDPHPGGGTFDVVSGDALDDGVAYFAGRRALSGQLGLYATPIGGAAALLVDQSMEVPGGTGNFYNLTATGLSASGGTLLFGNLSQNNAERGVYARSDAGVISRIADRNSTLPNSTSTFTFFYGLVQQGSSKSYFRANGNGGEDGLYLFEEGNMSKIVDKTTAIPGPAAALFASFSEFDVQDDLLTFAASSGDYRGIFSTTDRGQTIDVIADTETPMPNYAGWNFDALIGPRTNGQDVIFYGRSARDPNNGNYRREGIYGYVDGELQTLVDLTTLNPRGGALGAGGGFGGFDGVLAFEGDLFVFGAEHDGDAGGDEDGIYFGRLGGSLQLLIEEAQLFDGQAVEDLNGADLDGARIGFGFLSSDNVASYYVAAVPEPTSLLSALSGLGCGLLGVYRRADRRR